MAKLPAAATDVALRQDAALAQIPDLKPPGPEALELDAPPNQLRAEKSRLLENAGLNEFAIRELQAEQGGQGARWATLQIARIYQESGQTHRAIQFLKKSLPGYYSVDLDGAAAALLGDIVSASVLDGCATTVVGERAGPVPGGFADPAGERVQSWGGLERQCVWADATAAAGWSRRGTGGAHQALLDGSLLVPDVNIQLGTHYFKEMVTQYNGQVEYALAAYNAGSNRVDDWLGADNIAMSRNSWSRFRSPKPEIRAGDLRNAKVISGFYPRQ